MESILDEKILAGYEKPAFYCLESRCLSHEKPAQGSYIPVYRPPYLVDQDVNGFSVGDLVIEKEHGIKHGQVMVLWPATNRFVLHSGPSMRGVEIGGTVSALGKYYRKLLSAREIFDFFHQPLGKAA